jgi:hypothetical protein
MPSPNTLLLTSRRFWSEKEQVTVVSEMCWFIQKVFVLNQVRNWIDVDFTRVSHIQKANPQG